MNNINIWFVIFLLLLEVIIRNGVTLIVSILNILQPIAIIAASIATVYALLSWRREIKVKREYEVAEEVLSLFFESVERINDIRSPYISANELQNNKKEAAQSGDDNPHYAGVIFIRLQKHMAFFSRLHAMKNRFMAIPVSNNIEPFNDLDSILADIRIAANGICSLWQANKNDPKNSALHKKYGEALEKYLPVIQAGEYPDPISERVEKMISKAEDICRPKLGR
jgi:hypothetical protein